MKASRNRRINATPQQIWTLISTVEGLSSWHPGVVSAQHVDGPQEGVGRRHRMERMLYQHDLQVEQEVVEWEPGRRITLAHRRETIDDSEVVGVRDFTTTVDIQSVDEGAASKVMVTYRWTARIGIPWIQSVLFGGRVMGRELNETLEKINVHVTGKL